MNVLRLSLVLLVMIICETASAQTRFLVRFKDKGDNSFSLTAPSAFLSQRSIDRRTRYNIAYDSTDLPVTTRYVDSLRSVPNVTVLNVSKWLNQVSIQTTDPNAITRINSFPFVMTVSPIASRISSNGDDVISKFRELPAEETLRPSEHGFNYGLSAAQINIHNGQFLHHMGWQGQTMVIGMLDAGYSNYKVLRAFDSARANGQILGTWNFVRGDDSVNNFSSHGMQCFSVIASNIPGEFIGSAPKANFYLYLTEDVASEYPIEMHNWVCAAERLDSAGGDVISSSLGYYDWNAPLQSENYVYADMDGNTTMVTIGADLAAKKGMLVVNAAGNEGSNSWHYIIAPADGDSVLAVGAVNTSGQFAPFSSYGPSSDGRVKPDVMSVGWGTVVQSPGGNIGTNNGTSFACPNMAGLATCLWQGFPEANNMDIVNALRMSSHLYPNHYDSLGYGIPDMKKASLFLIREIATSSAALSSPCKTTVNWNSKDNANMRYELERKDPGSSDWTKVHEIYSQGTGFASRNYTFSDTLINVAAGAVQYRIKQILDTSATGFYGDYIDSASMSLANSCITTSINPVDPNATGLMIIPNPAKEVFTLKISSQNAMQHIEIRITDAQGKLISTTRRSKPAGDFNITIPVGQLSKGKYYVSVFN
ncbi:MAG TPA: S8 family serine peptidase, partial [Chitinophagaceae bacterium]